MLEKVLRLVEVLPEIDRHPLLTQVLVLKGGTSLNVFHLNLPRISVDLDFNYIGQVDRDQMRTQRAPVESAIEAVVRSLGYPAIRAGFENTHASTRWELPYAEAGGSSDTWKYRSPGFIAFHSWAPSAAWSTLSMLATLQKHGFSCLKRSTPER